MRPDFIITQRVTANGLISIVLPTHTGALNWMFAHVEATERRNMSANLGADRLAQFKGDAALENLTFSEPQSSPQPAGIKEQL
jgi:hypothetical protein